MQRAGDLLQRFFGSPLPWLAIIASVLSFNIGRAFLAELPEPLPIYATLPDFELTDQDGRRYGTKDLRGVKLFPNAGHWVQQEFADETNDAIIQFIKVLD